MDPVPQNSDNKLWKQAQHRVVFRKNLIIYILATILAWLVWFVTAQLVGEYYHIWPIYITLGWGIVIIFLYFRAYKWNDDSVKKEFERMKKQQEEEKIPEQNTNEINPPTPPAV